MDTRHVPLVLTFGCSRRRSRQLVTALPATRPPQSLLHIIRPIGAVDCVKLLQLLLPARGVGALFGHEQWLDEHGGSVYGGV
jgi:hypothetical protein